MGVVFKREDRILVNMCKATDLPSVGNNTGTIACRVKGDTG